MKNTKYNVVIADNQVLITESLKLLINNSIEYKLIGLTNDYNELINLLENNEVDILICDFNQFNFGGFEDLKEIREKYARTFILILTNHLNRNDLNEFNKIGIKNIIYKTVDVEELFLALDATIRNKKFFSEDILNLLMENNISKMESIEPSHLTPAEIEIIKNIANGLTTKEIAEKKHVSFHTVMSHRKNIFRKLGINSSSELLMYAVKAGLISDIEYYI